MDAAAGSPGPWTLRSLLHASAQWGEQPALIALAGESQSVLSFAALADLVGRLAAGLRRAGVERGEPVLLMGENSADWVVVFLALGTLGALAVPCDHLATPKQIQRILDDSRCGRAFVAGASMETLRAAAQDRRLTVFTLDAADDTHAAPSWRSLLGDTAEELPPLDPAVPAVLVYTSGTTGAPKSFTLSHANIGANVQALYREHLAGPGDRLLLPLPLHHVYPIVVGLLVPLASGAAVVFPAGVAGPEIARALREAEVTGIIGVPRLYAALTAGIAAQIAGRGRLAVLLFRALLGLSVGLLRRRGWRIGPVLFRPLLARIGPKLRFLVSGGAALGEDLVWQLEGLGWKVRNGYGLAETASTFTGNLPGRERIGSEGRPFQGGELRIAESGAQGVGEIQLRGPNVFSGYRNNAEANREAFTEDGWFRTGDLGRLDAEGFLVFKGRAKELIVLGGGKNVQPEDVEGVYGASPFVREIAVLEVEGALHGLVLPNHEAVLASGTPRIEDALRVALQSAAAHLPSHERLAGYALIREPLPRTRLGKFRRFLLPELYERARAGAAAARASEPSPEDDALLARPLAGAVWRLLNARYSRQRLSLDASLSLDLGIDSLEWITLGLELERRLGVRLSETETAEAFTVRDLIALVEAAAQRPTAAVDEGEAPAVRLTVEQRRWTREGNLGHRLVRAVLFALNALVMRAFFALRAVGGDRLPSSGPLIIVANHVSDLDPLAVSAALPLRHRWRSHWGGDVARLFSGPLRRLFCRSVSIFPVDERSPGTTLALAAETLAQGGTLIWFPEAWRSPDGRLQRFFPGIGSLIESTGATAVPAYISGSYQAMPRWARVPRRHPISVTFGAPLTAETLAAGSGDTAAWRITHALEQAVAALAPREDGDVR